MEQSKYQQLKNLIEAQKKEIDTLDNDLKSQQKVINGIMLIFQDSDSQVQTIKELLIKANVMSEDEFTVIVDSKRGLRGFTPEDKVMLGDVVWADYVAFCEGNEVGSDSDLPCRIGSGAINFERALVGHHVGDVVEYDHVVKEAGEFKGKTIHMTIKIKKAKTKIKESKDAEPTTNPGLGLAPTGPQAAPDAMPEAGGRGDEEQRDGEHPTVPGVGGEPAGIGQASDGSEPPGASVDGNGPSV